MKDFSEILLPSLVVREIIRGKRDANGSTPIPSKSGMSSGPQSVRNCHTRERITCCRTVVELYKKGRIRLKEFVTGRIQTYETH